MMGQVVSIPARPERDRRIAIRLTEAEATRIEAYAARHGLGVSATMRLAAMQLLDRENRFGPVDSLETALRNIVGPKGE